MVMNPIVNQVMICMPLYYFYIHVPCQALLPMALNATDTPDTLGCLQDVLPNSVLVMSSAK